MPHVTEPDLRGIRHIHCIAIAGVGMATLAAMLKARGYQVTGSDRGIYPPMSDFLAQADIPVIQGYQGENLSPEPDLVVVGNAVSRTNPEVVSLLASTIPYVSFPQAVGEFFLAGKTLVGCGWNAWQDYVHGHARLGLRAGRPVAGTVGWWGQPEFWPGLSAGDWPRFCD